MVELLGVTHNQIMVIAAMHTMSTLYMCGLIWFVQLVHYPLHGFVGEQTFTTYQAEHVRRTSWAVMLPMVIELGTAILLCIALPKTLGAHWPVVGLLLLGKVWIATAFLSVPAHQALSTEFNIDVHRKLVGTNWVRTFGWSARAPIATYLLIKIASGGGS